ncbi:aryl-alcohol dehydrogenase [Dacryopinax primogenitus]|uniref:Aryl-alcohol dehydrogenase n=1 Tax=Dacryopinax primogenitus (strain DJM 731) TaxID=1858805 RepID=M5G0K4_DACPD|nr:aryl-alcohol dehydrogenase [Dacryopinax primogenitus]EJT97332.1 aryl-alcohol dehydrogenase [Dacryopinax primogenitus]
MSMWAPAPPADTPLGEYRLLSPSAGVRVSPLCLGGMSIGDAWGQGMGDGVALQGAFETLDLFYKSGGNFIDTSNNYQDEQSEKWIGEWMKARKNRNEIVLATKFTTSYRKLRNTDKIHVNFTGNSSKSLHVSVADSLEKLQTTYIDLLYVHWWDYTTPIPELMQSLNSLVAAGKVLYLGVSDTPAWVVSKSNQYARDHGMAQFVVYQGKWSCLERSFERDILPMCHAEGMGLAPWGVIGQGKFRTKAQLEERLKQGSMRWGSQTLTPEEKAVSAALEKVAEEVGQPGKLANVAIAYVMHKQAYVFPIIGGSKTKYLLENIEALKIQLTQEQIDYLDSAIEFKPGFPHDFIGPDPALSNGVCKNFLLNSAARIHYVTAPKQAAV